MGTRALAVILALGVAVFVGVQRSGPPDHSGDGERPEVAAVEAVSDGDIHEEEFARAEPVAALPAGCR